MSSTQYSVESGEGVESEEGVESGGGMVGVRVGLA